MTEMTLAEGSVLGTRAQTWTTPDKLVKQKLSDRMCVFVKLLW